MEDRVNVKVEPRSTFTFMRVKCALRKNYATVEIHPKTTVDWWTASGYRVYIPFVSSFLFLH